MIRPSPLGSLRRVTTSALLAVLLLTACGGDKPAAMVASAKEYLAKHDHKAAAIELKNALQKDPQLSEARFLLGKALLEGGDATGAEIELRRALELKYSADEVTPVLVRAMLQKNESEKAIKEFGKVELTSPAANAELQVNLGQAYLMQRKPELAEAAFSTALRLQPGFAAALTGQARLKASQGDLPGAVALLDVGLEQSPRLFEAWQLKGELLVAMGDAAGAMTAFRKALESKPDSLSAHSAVIRGLLAEGKMDEATQQLEAMKKVSANHPQTLYLRSMLAYQKKDLANAKELIQQLLKATPDSPYALQLAGVIEYEQKAYPQAEAYLLKALPRTPEIGVSRRVLIATYLHTNQPARALAILEPVLDKIENDSNMLALAGQVFIQNGRADQAAIYFGKASALDPKHTGKRTSLAMVNLARGEADTAFRDLEQVAAADTGNRADLALIAAHLKRREYDQALKAIASLEKKQPDNPLAYNLRGTALLGKRDVAAARKSFEEALAKNPAYFPAAANLASLDLGDGKPEEAKKRFEGVLAKDPKNVQAMLALAQLRAKAGATTEEVAALISKAVTANPTEAAPRLALISYYLGKSEFKNALSAAQEAVAALPETPEILDAAGRAQQAAGDNNQALATYGKLATLRPDSILPYVRMAEVDVAAKNRDGALQSLQKALKVKADSIEVQRAIIMLELEAGHVKEALAVAREVQKQRPKEAIGYVFEGDAQATQKAWSEAIAVYRSGIKSATEPGDLAPKLHLALLASNNAAEAERFADSWLKERPKDVRFRLYLAEQASGRKDYASAIKQYRILLESQPDNPAVLNNLAWVAGQLKDPKAVEYAEKANKLAPNQPALMDTLGTLLVDKGDTARGLELLKRALDMAPQAALIRLNYTKALVKAGKKDEARKELEQLAKLGDKFPAQAEVAQLQKSL